MATAEKATTKDNLSGIGGWLILVLIGLLISPIRIAHFAYENFWPLYSEGLWNEFTNPSSELFHPSFAPILTFEIFSSIILLLGALLNLYLFLRKSKYTPKVAISWFVFALLFAITDAFLIRQDPTLSSEVTGVDTIKQVGGPLLRAAIWIPYFLVSKRVKATFVK